jgi:hypothetical protein
MAREDHRVWLAAYAGKKGPLREGNFVNRQVGSAASTVAFHLNVHARLARPLVPIFVSVTEVEAVLDQH